LHQQFRESFVRAAKDASFQRHAYAAFVLANFWSLGAERDIASNAVGGLSGMFLPVKPPLDENPDFIELVTYGKSDTDIDNGWSWPANEISPGQSVRGYIAQLSPRDMDLPSAKVLRMTVHRLPRHSPPWGATVGLRNIKLQCVDARQPSNASSS
ncbi:hypothetical protein, partial [Bradyrhizobium sp. SUTN9-2]|uniref:hypothetical protein n=1 Tax=Bradyrhizobium sp. SUTN9-2 TaxID=1167456 RepID=UPI0019580602